MALSVRSLPVFDSNYNSLQLSVEHQLFPRSLTANAAYTYSHGLTDNQSDRSSGLQNTYCRKCEYGSSGNQSPACVHRKLLFISCPGTGIRREWRGTCLAGWQASGIITVNSGLPLTVFAGTDRAPLATPPLPV